MSLGSLPLAVCLTALAAFADNGAEAWLGYRPLGLAVEKRLQDVLPAVLVQPETGSAILDNARAELLRGIRNMAGRTLRTSSGVPSNQEGAIFIGTEAVLRGVIPDLDLPRPLAPGGYALKSIRWRGARSIVIAGSTPAGALYGTFALLRKIAIGEFPADLNEVSEPAAPVRWVNEWNNLDGSIERGYGGRSIFFENDSVRADLSRVSDYGRLLASLGINGCAVNNVNANPKALTPDFIPQLARIAAALRPWGVRMVVSVDFGSPKRTGGLATFDPLEPAVAGWWKAKVDELYAAIPDLAGLLMKADSEGRVGPSAYGRTHADAANTVARALQPHGGLMFYRAFVYNHNLDWRNLKNDRARAAYDNFQPLDGAFDDNVVIQIKNGPIDFQVREPASPLSAALHRTNQAIELQITQEYFGQARHMVCLVPYWKDVLDTGLGVPVKTLVTGKAYSRKVGGFVGVSNAGLDANWYGNHLSQVNLYGFGRLAWNPDLTSQQIIEEWARLTFGNEPALVNTITGMQLRSWRVYENYTGPLGLQTLTAITGTHFGPAVEASERNGWGQWHRADEKGVGMDRSVATGTGFSGQFPVPLAQQYESIATTPDDLLLFLHHVPYTHALRSGKTVIQTIYDLHYAGANAAAQYIGQWKGVGAYVDQQRFTEVLRQLEYQAGAAEEWRDAICTWFRRTSGIPDVQGRVGNYPGRVEAESMQLSGYAIKPASPWEAASGGSVIECATPPCAAVHTFTGMAGWYTLNVRYFDQNDGVSKFRIWVGTQEIDTWAADDQLPSRHVDSASSTRRLIQGIALRPGDAIRIEGTPDGHETAALDYLEIQPQN